MLNAADIVIVAIPGYPPPLSTLVIVAPDAKLKVVAAVPALIQLPPCCKEIPETTSVKLAPDPEKEVAVITPDLPS